MAPSCLLSQACNNNASPFFSLFPVFRSSLPTKPSGFGGEGGIAEWSEAAGFIPVDERNEANPDAGAVDETRTRDLNLGKVALYQLSYYRRMVPWGGIEPPTRRFSVYCSTD